MASAAAGRQQAGCFKCGQTGHWGNACTVPREQWISQPRPAADAECYKCGLKGHWARDCAAPREQWVAPRPPGAAPPGTAAGAGSGDENNEPPDAGLAAAAGRVGARKAQRKKPKLTVDDLRKPMGMVYVVTDFADEFRRVYKGPGHEAGDLRRLLALYQGWHRRVFPFTTFDGFLEDLEKLGATAAFKASLRELRHDAVKAALEPENEAPPPQQAADGGEDTGAISPPDSYRGGNDNDMDDFDDYLDNMDAEFQAAPAVGAAENPAAGAGSADGSRPQTASQQAEQEMDEFERLLAMSSDDEDNGGIAGATDGHALVPGSWAGQVNAAEATAAGPLTASQQAEAEMDEFERQLAFGATQAGPDEVITAEAAPTSAAALLTASQQAEAEMDEFERQLAFGDTQLGPEEVTATAAPMLVAAPLTASQQAEAEMDAFERQMAFGETQPAADMQLTATASQQAREAAAEMDDFEQQLAFGDTQPAADMQPAADASQPPAFDAHEAERSCGPETDPGQPDHQPSSPLVGGEQQQGPQQHEDAVPSTSKFGVPALSSDDAKMLDAATEPPRPADGDIGMSSEAVASVLGDKQPTSPIANPGHPAAASPSAANAPGAAVGAGAAVADVRGATHAADADDGADHDASGADDMDLADMDDDDLLRLVMSQAEGMAGLQ